MATITYETPSSFTNALTTELNSLADGSSTAASSAIDNSTNLDLFADVSAILGSINPTATSARIDVHLVPRLGDGSTYADIGAATVVATIPVTTGSAAKNLGTIGIRIPPGHYKLAVTNRTGVTLAASGNTVSYRTYGLASA